MSYKPTFKEIRSAMLDNGYTFFTAPLSINIVGVRCSLDQNLFDDVICVLWYDHAKREQIRYFSATTLPGYSWLRTLINPKGSFIMAEGQYKGAYEIGLHKGRWALVQKKPVSHYRDNNKDLKHDLKGELYSDVCAANIHDTNSINSKYVNKWSAGCQVINNNFGVFRAICESSARLYGSSFTYTLLGRDRIR